MQKETTILLVDDHVMLRKGLCSLLEKEEGLVVVGEAGDGLEAIERAVQLQPDIIVMDINMPELNGIEASRKILSDAPGSKILALSIHSGRHYVELMLEAGVSGYLLKKNAPEELIKAIHALNAGKGYLSADITEIVLERMRKPDESPKAPAALTASKLSRPQVEAEYVRNPHLTAKLESSRNKKLTLVAAPAHSGKTALVSSWLEQSEVPSAWLTLDKSDSEFPAFIKSLLAAIHTLYPASCGQVQKMIEGYTVPPVSTLAKALTSDLELLPERFLLVLDNYEETSSQRINDFLSNLLTGSLPTIHLVLITSRNPSLPLRTLRVNNELSELRLANLLPDLEETVHWRDILTNREYEILLLLEQRFRNKEIADKLFLSEETVKSHLRNLFSKLNANSRRHAVVKAVELGILPG
jgi:DNA-binding NarL/FixJ family response regulator